MSNGHRDALTLKKAGYLGIALNAGTSFFATEEGKSESPVEILEKALGARLIWTGGLTYL